MKRIISKRGFHNDLHNSYMILDGKDSKLDYQIPMILNNPIPNLLKFNYKFFDNELKYYYDITNKQTLEEYMLVRKIDYNFLFQFLKSLSVVTSELKSYLVNSEHLVLDTNYIFLEEEKNRFYFCYYRDFKENITVSLHELSYVFMEHGIEDEKGRMLANELCNKSKDKKFSIDNILDLAIGKYYKNQKVGLHLKASIESIYSRLREEEKKTDEQDFNKESGIRAGLNNIKTWFHDINDRILNK